MCISSVDFLLYWGGPRPYMLLHATALHVVRIFKYSQCMKWRDDQKSKKDISRSILNATESSRSWLNVLIRL